MFSFKIFLYLKLLIPNATYQNLSKQRFSIPTKVTNYRNDSMIHSYSADSVVLVFHCFIFYLYQVILLRSYMAKYLRHAVFFLMSLCGF